MRGSSDVPPQTLGFVPVTDVVLQHPDPADWLMWRRTLDSWGYSPLTNTMYFPLRNMCQRLLATTAPDASHRIYALAVRHELAPGTEQLGAVYAISAETGETTWLHEQREATLSLVATGGGLVFGGDATTPSFLQLTPELRPSNGNNLCVFALP